MEAGWERVAAVGTGRQWSMEMCFGAGGSRSPGCARPPEGSLDKSLGPLLTVQVLGGRGGHKMDVSRKFSGDGDAAGPGTTR